MASNTTSTNESQNTQQQTIQNVVKQEQGSIEQKTAEAIEATTRTVPKPPKTKDKKKDSLSSRSQRKDESRKRPPDPPDGFSRARCLMFFPTSGRMGFDKVKLSDELPPIEILREMIAYEINIRLSEPIQELMNFYHKDEAALRQILDLIQQHVVEQFGYHDVNALRTALYRFPDDTIVKSAYYVKHNKVTQGLIEQGQCARDVDLYTIEGQPINLFSQITTGQPLIILAGSTS